MTKTEMTSATKAGVARAKKICSCRHRDLNETVDAPASPSLASLSSSATTRLSDFFFDVVSVAAFDAAEEAEVEVVWSDRKGRRSCRIVTRTANAAHGNKPVRVNSNQVDICRGVTIGKSRIIQSHVALKHMVDLNLFSLFN